MIRTKILGLGSYVPERVVGNHELAFLNDQHVRQATQQIETSDEWIQQRTGIESRRYVPNDGSVATSDLALEAARCAIADAGIEDKDVDCIKTMSPLRSVVLKNPTGGSNEEVHNSHSDGCTRRNVRGAKLCALSEQ